MTNKDENKEGLEDYPILRSLRNATEPPVPEGYFENLTIQIIEKTIQNIPETKKGKIIERNRWLGIAAIVSLAAAAAVLLLMMIKMPVLETLDEATLFSQVSREEIIEGMEWRDVNIELIVSTFEYPPNSAKSFKYNSSLFDSLSDEQNFDILRDIDPTEIYDL